MMASRIRKGICSSLILVGWLVLLPVVTAGETGPLPMETPDGLPADGVSRAMSIPDGEPLPPPTTVRSMRYMDGDALPFCLECPNGVWVTLLSHTFTTDPTTSYVELDWTGQTTMTNVSPMVKGVRFRVFMAQGAETAWFPGAGNNGGYPYFGRNDFSGSGSQWYGGYHGILLAEPDTSTTLTIQLRADLTEAYACFQNMTIRHD